MNSTLAFYILFGSLAGFVSSVLYKAFRGRSWQLCTIVTAIFFPGLCFVVFLFFNIILFFFKTTASVPVIDVILVAALWCCVSVPMVFVGAYFGYKMESLSFPTVTSTIARAIPTPSLVAKPVTQVLFAGMIPFAAAYVELFFIMSSLWMDQYYYVFGFTLLVYVILLISAAEVTLLLVYYQLCNENHRWWWFSLLSSGSIAYYLFAYSFVWFKGLEASRLLITYMLYFGYMFLISFAVFLISSSFGSLLSLWFVRKMFASIKVD
jgi:transmembrane 9 superfamily protein 2/4